MRKIVVPSPLPARPAGDVTAPIGDTDPMDTDPTAHATPPTPARDFEPHLEALRTAPADGGRLELIVLRPHLEQRELAQEAILDADQGVVGDNWQVRGSGSRPDGSANPEAQVTIMSSRVLAAIEPDRSRWALAGDQLLVDADLSIANLPAGTRLAIGEAVLVISETPHTGCAKFSARFGSDALRWINSPIGRELRMRGLNARIVQGGVVRVGDTLRKA